MIRKLKSGEYRLYSGKADRATGRRRNFGTFRTRAAAAQHERAVQRQSSWTVRWTVHRITPTQSSETRNRSRIPMRRCHVPDPLRLTHAAKVKPPAPVTLH